MENQTFKKIVYCEFYVSDILIIVFIG